MNGQRELLKVAGLDAALGRRPILHDISLTVSAGEIVVIIGPNGAGKTTLLRAIAGLIPVKGAIVIDGRPAGRLSLATRASLVTYLPQGHVFHWPLAVADIVGLGRLPRGAGADLSGADRTAVVRAMSATGVAEYAERAVTTLSGGERARVALARVLATEAPLILADEPTAALDPRYQLVVLDILRKHADAGGAVVAVVHDLGLAARHADRLLVLDKGRIAAEGAPKAVLTRARLADVFGIYAQVVDMQDAPIVIPWSVI